MLETQPFKMRLRMGLRGLSLTLQQHRRQRQQLLQTPVGYSVQGVGVQIPTQIPTRAYSSETPDLSRHIQAFEKFVGKASVVVDGDVLEQFSTDWTQAFTGDCLLALRPKTTEEVRCTTAARFGSAPSVRCIFEHYH